jgi:hypothetical protein
VNQPHYPLASILELRTSDLQSTTQRRLQHEDATAAGNFLFGWRVAGLPFVPFDTFDWLTRVLPGRLMAFGIGTMGR